MNLNDPVSSLMAVDLQTAAPDTPVEQLRDDLMASGHHHLPVVDDEGLLLGILGHTDIGHAPVDAVAGTLLRSEPVTVRPDDPLGLAVAIFSNGIFHALPVVDEEGGLCGLLTTSDLMRALLAELVVDADDDIANR